MTRPNIRKQRAYKAGYASGRNGQMWNRGRINRNGNSVNAWYYRGWNLGHRVTRHLQVYGDAD
ncbi:MAG TPA: hypothetical protein PK691_01785 [Thermomicrobiales bacterium]|nr:hypothetical protein [Thermomicrobiales bacterium]